MEYLDDTGDGGGGWVGLGSAGGGARAETCGRVCMGDTRAHARVGSLSLSLSLALSLTEIDRN